jgi:hypothetical protein
MARFKEHQSVVLLRDLEESELWDRGPGTIDPVEGKNVVPAGTHAFIVSLHSQREFMIEIMDAEGWTIGLADVKAMDVRLSEPSDFPAQVGSDVR